MAAILFDESRFPLVIAAFGEVPTSEEFETFLARLDALLARGRHAVILDASRASPLPAGLRRRQAEWNAKRTLTVIRRSAGVAFVVTNPLIRGIVTAINWLHPPPYRFTIVATLAEGEAWCSSQLQA
jgi:hypothetical protein